LSERIFLFESTSPSTEFYINRLTGEIRLLNELGYQFFTTKPTHSAQFTFALKEFELFNLTNTYAFTVTVHFKLEPSSVADLAFIAPRLARQNYDLEVDKRQLSGSKADALLIESFDQRFSNPNHELFTSQMFNMSYSVQRKKSQPNVELPFYVDSNNGQLFYFNSQLNTLDSYAFTVQLFYKFNLNERLVYAQQVDVQVEIANNFRVKNQQLTVERDENETLFERTVASTLDLDIPITSSDLLMYIKSPLVGFISPDESLIDRHGYLLDPPTFTLIVTPPPLMLPKRVLTTPASPAVNSTTTRAKNPAQHKPKKPGNRNSTGKKLSNQRRVSKRSAPVPFLVSYFAKTKLETNEQELLYENLYSMLFLDPQSGALYLKSSTNETVNTPLEFYAKIAKLTRFYYHERGLTTKLIKLNVELINSVSNVTVTRWINLVFSRPPAPLSQLSTNLSEAASVFSIDHQNKFLTNSNNMLNLFRNGDEFVLSVNLPENSQQSVGPARLVLDLNRYFRSRLAGTANEFIYLNLAKQLRFYLTSTADDDSANELFELDTVVNNLLLMKRPVQFDYEAWSSSYLVKLMIVQYLDTNLTTAKNHPASTSTINNDHLVFKSAVDEPEPSAFVYWLDVTVNVVNELDEPFVCTQPVYTVEVDENEVKNKRLLTIELTDYEATTSDDTASAVSMDDESRYRAQIVAGNAQGLFQMHGLSLHTGSSARKLDRETRATHELEIRIVDQLASNYSAARSAAATCKVIVSVGDINDNRPIVNDVELTMYDRLDAKLIDEMRVPIANPIAVDQDLIAKLTYSIVSIKIVNGKK
jgi:hypothetical protein